MKKKLVSLSVAFFSIFILASNAFADFDAIYMVDSSSSTTSKDSFGWNEQPWLYLNLPYSTLTYSVSWWNPDDTNLFYNDFKITSGVDQVWHTLDNWSDVRRLGFWNIRADYSSAGGCGIGITGFTVTPEPYSSILLVFGAGCLGTFIGLKRKKIAKANT